MAFHTIVSIFPISLCWLSNEKILGVDGSLMINNKLIYIDMFYGLLGRKMYI
jgi:hypothetical protein